MELLLKNQQVAEVLKSINQTNAEYVGQNEDNIRQFSKIQSPIATLVMCCDSRAHTTSFTYNPENNFFIIRNIGNQYVLNQGCVEFGVRNLNTPLLIFMGHTQCGAIKASMGNYQNLAKSIINEIEPLAKAIHPNELIGDDNQQYIQAVINNVNSQVDLALKDFTDLRIKRKIAIIGMVLDLDNSICEGHGRISVTNVNGETDINILKHNPLVMDFFNKI